MEVLAEAPSQIGRSEVSDRKGLRIVLATGNYNHIVDGVALTLNRLVGHLERGGHRVLVLGPTSRNPPIDHQGVLIPTRSIPLPGREEYRLSLGLGASQQRTLVSFNPDVVHIATPDLLGIGTMSWAKKHGIPTVSSYHTDFISYLKYFRVGGLVPVLHALNRRFYNECSCVYVPSTAIAAALRAQGVASSLRLWQRGVNIDRFSPAKRCSEWRDLHGLAPNVPIVVFVSRLVWEKGLRTLINVLERLDESNVPHQSVIVGEGPALKVMRAALPQSRFLGFLAADELAAAYACSDVFLFPSDTETFGNVTLEAMASGLPTVCADAGGSRDLVRDGETGFLCPPGNEDLFYEATRRLLTDRGLRIRMGDAARVTALSYEWPAILKEAERGYSDAIQRSGGRRTTPRGIQSNPAT